MHAGLRHLRCTSFCATAAGRAAAPRHAAALPAAPPPPAGDAVNKQQADARVYQYLLDHTREPQVLAELRQATAERFPQAPTMAVSPEQGAFLGWLVGTLGAREVVEVGVFTGYSSTAMALAMPPGGRLVACDRDPAAMAVAQEFWRRAGVAGRVQPRLAPALDTLQAMLDSGAAGTVDFAFLDADKRGYMRYYELLLEVRAARARAWRRAEKKNKNKNTRAARAAASLTAQRSLLQLLRPGGTLAVDNVLWYGRVADPAAEDKTTAAVREFNDFVHQDARVAAAMVPIGDGIMLCTKKQLGGSQGAAANG
jgi:predicted O-methyltransferase YrrM